MGHRLLCILLFFVLAQEARAQLIQLDLESAELRTALLALREQAGIDVVFSDGIVEGRTTSCSYTGDRALDALQCVLDETGLRAERVRWRQYVVVAASTDTTAAGRAPRFTISGFVVDAESGDVLPGAHAYLPDLRVGTVTNEAGYFALPALPAGEYRIQFTYIGYGSEERVLSGGAEPHTIELKPRTLQGGNIVIEGQSQNQAAAATIPGLIAEPVRELDRLPSFSGESDLFQALQWFPGIRKSGEINGGMIIRGAPPDQNLYLIDGAPVYHPWHAFSLISTFQTETFRSIRLYRGGYPSEFGGRISSVLDAQMRDGSSGGPEVRIGLSALSARFLVETPATKNTSFMIAGRRSYLDKLIGREHPVENAAGRRDTLRTGYYFYDTSAKFTWQMSREDRLSVSFYRGGDDLDLRLPFDLSLDFSSWLRPPDLFFEVAHRWENRLISARYQRLNSDRTYLTTTAYYATYDASEWSYLRPTSAATMRSAYSVYLRDAGLKVDLDYFYSVAHQLQFGAHAVVRDFDSSLDAIVRRSPRSVDVRDQVNKTTKTDLAAYAQDIWKPSERWTLRPGVRVSVFGAGLYTDISPGLSVAYAVDPEYLRLKAGASRQVQYLHRLRDRYAFTYDLVSSRWIPAGEEVKPSRGYQVSGGFESDLAPGVEISGDAYWRETDNVLLPEDIFRRKDELVGPGIDLGELLGQYVEGDARGYGIELSANIERNDWSLLLSYAGGRSLSRSSLLGEEKYRSARYDIPRSLRVLGARDLGNWRFTAALDLRSGYPTTVPVAQYEIGDPLDPDARYLHRPNVNNGRLPPYFRVDVSAQYLFDLLGADWHARLYVHNVTNRRNVVARQYLPADDGLEVENRRGLPILPLFEIEMQL